MLGVAREWRQAIQEVISLEKLYTTVELAEHLDTNPGTLSNWRITGISSEGRQ